jgi:SAM-dependent methyltransferase
MPPAPLPRRDEHELLDRVGHDHAELTRSLAHVEAVHRWLGGARAARRHLEDLVPPPTGSIRILDVGTGDGRVLSRLATWVAERFDRSVLAAGVDLHPEILAVARARLEPGGAVRLVRADALRLPFPDGVFDVALSTLTLHHFPAATAARVVAEMARVARGRVLVADLERNRAHYLGARLLALTVWRGNPITRHDGPLSVLRSFTADELETVGRAAGLRDLSVRRHLPFRLMLEGRP